MSLRKNHADWPAFYAKCESVLERGDRDESTVAYLLGRLHSRICVLRKKPDGAEELDLARSIRERLRTVDPCAQNNQKNAQTIRDLRQALDTVVEANRTRIKEHESDVTELKRRIAELERREAF